MLKIFPLLALIAFSASCKTWSDEDKDAFNQSCTQEAITWAGTPAIAKSYCDCIFEKMTKKYPDENDALEHMDSLGKDPDLIKCKEETLKTMSPR
jgi:hypothetical protein